MTEETGTNNEKAAVPSNEGNHESMENFLEKYSVGAFHRGKTVEGTVVVNQREAEMDRFQVRGFLPRKNGATGPWWRPRRPLPWVTPSGCGWSP